jgi:hypothetical protein
MERTTSIIRAKEIMGKNFIGIDELISIRKKIGIYIPEELKTNCPLIHFSEKTLEKNKNDYILIFGIPYYKDKTPLTIVKMREHFGLDPDKSEPCFYNQDWYLYEEFANSTTLKENWYLIRKEVYDEYRGIPIDIIKKNSNLKLPKAVLCVYAFFCYNLVYNQFLWVNDFVWCEDTDIYGDSIYIGRYFKGNNKNGIEIHRVLSIKKNYSTIELIRAC